MVNVIASRVAAGKLIWIVMVLFVPLLVLGAMLVRTLEHDIAFTNREAQGAAYIKLTMPILLDAFASTSNQAAIDAFVDKGASIAASMELSAAHRELTRLVRLEQPNYPAIVALSREHIRLAGERSGLILDPVAETYHLSYLTTVSLPSLVSNFAKIERASAPGTGPDPSGIDRLTGIALAAGAWRETLDRAYTALRAAAASAPNDPLYVTINQDMIEIGGFAASVVDALRLENVSSAQRREAVRTITLEMRDRLGSGIRRVAEGLQARLEGLLQQRQKSMSTQMFAMVGGSLIATLLGLGSAIRMFQSTLKRLDDVEDAKVQAESARADAETMAERMEAVNNDIVKLNLELTANVTRLRQAQDELLKKGRMEQLGQLTATVAHELRNPLGAVRTSAFLLERKIKGKGLGVESQLQRINNGVVRCDNIITQLLDFSRASKLNLAAADLDAWLLKVIEEEADRLPEQVQIEFAGGLAGRNVPFDGPRLSRAIANLLSNASEAMVGKGDETAATANPRIVVETRVTGRGFEISVKDNGPGIPADVLPRILEPLFTTKNFGTGLGLPAVERILEQHGGGLEVRSEPGHGACFTLWLPVTDEHREAA